MVSTQKIRAYRDILTPALHRRFAKGTFLVTLLVTYVVSVLIGGWNGFFWTWFPIGAPFIRTIALFFCALAICILRVSQWHVGIRTTPSPIHTFVRYLFKFETIRTCLVYLVSAWGFWFIYTISAGEHSSIYWVVQGKYSDRLRFNESAVYLMNYYILCAFSQTFYHILFDIDRLSFPEHGDNKAPLRTIWRALPSVFKRAFSKALWVMLATPLIYFALFRSTAWKYSLLVARIRWSLPKTSALPASWPFHIWVLTNSIWGGFLLFALWDISNLAFDVYVAQPPLKEGKPITDASNDPNGSLINGLKSVKMLNKSFAFRELRRLTEDNQARRRTIFEEIERNGGSTWIQILTICTENISEMNNRISDYLRPPTATKSDLQVPSTPPREEQLPRFGTPIKEDNIMLEPTGSRAAVDEFVKSLGQSSSPYNAAHRIIRKVESASQHKTITPAGAIDVFREYSIAILKSPIGHLFQQTHQRRALSLVLGSPYGELSMLVNAIKSLKQLALSSLEEDNYGKVQRNVHELLELFTVTVETLEALEEKLLSDIHWTDVEFRDDSEVPAIEVLLQVLRAALSDLITHFADYSDAMSLSSRLMRKAREASVDLRKTQRKRSAGRGRGGAGGGRNEGRGGGGRNEGRGDGEGRGRAA